ncbi:hypothetical protein K461DRAFT_274165 [Myriangium duriaei CBS 260.36]|uniref:2EXR domain-containing protein n=1 Tax=Myriangium duriaei CBS 260.36 TaxID=1168546 RepID=A0A9P4JD41_9PEZI|nr:hypothetical protein K461DRAFT_274165 [Myriangium duriaei CBS 260.36]
MTLSISPQQFEPDWHPLFHGAIMDDIADSVVAKNVARMTVYTTTTSKPVDTGTSESCVAKMDFWYRIHHDATVHKDSGPLRGILLGSTQPFSIEKAVIEHGPYKGRFAFFIDPVPLPNNIFPFLKLPVELRMMIYEYVLHHPKIIYIRNGSRAASCPVEHGIKGVNLSLLAVSKQIRAETAPLFFSANQFVFYSTTTAVEFLRLVGQDNVRWLRRMAIWFYWYVTTGTEMMQRLVNTDLIVLYIFFGGHESDKIVRSMSPWITAQGDRNIACSRLRKILSVRRSTGESNMSKWEDLEEQSIVEEAWDDVLFELLRIRYFEDLSDGGEPDEGA